MIWLQWCWWQCFADDFMMVSIWRCLRRDHNVDDFFNAKNRPKTAVTNIHLLRYPSPTSLKIILCYNLNSNFYLKLLTRRPKEFIVIQTCRILDNFVPMHIYKKLSLMHIPDCAFYIKLSSYYSYIMMSAIQAFIGLRTGSLWYVDPWTGVKYD